MLPRSFLRQSCLFRVRVFWKYLISAFNVPLKQSARVPRRVSSLYTIGINSFNLALSFIFTFIKADGMRLHETIIMIFVFFVMAILFLPSCATTNSRVLNHLPSPALMVQEPSEREEKPAVSWTPPPSIVPQEPVKSTYLPLPPIDSKTPAEWYPHVKSRKWDAIIIHHSASPTGGARAFNRAHKARGWDELGYDFVIGNNTDTPNGYVETGSRWLKQKKGAHCKTPSGHFNDHGIGICLVGNFNDQYPSSKQLASLRKLVKFLSTRYHLSSNRIFGHGEVPGTHTECPGKHMPMNQIRTFAG